MWGAIIQGVLGLAKAGYGAYQTSNAKKLASQNAFPDYVIPSQFYDNVGLLQNRAQEGISQDTLAFLAQQNQQNLAASTNAILQGGGSVNNIAALYQGNQAQNAQLAQLDEQLRLQNVNNLIESRKELAGQELYKWKINKFDRWRDKATAAAMLGAQGQKNIIGGIDMFATSSANFIDGAAGKWEKDDSSDDSDDSSSSERPTSHYETPIGPPTASINGVGNPSVPSTWNDFNNINTGWS